MLEQPGHYLVWLPQGINREKESNLTEILRWPSRCGKRPERPRYTIGDWTRSEEVVFITANTLVFVVRLLRSTAPVRRFMIAHTIQAGWLSAGLGPGATLL